MGKKLFMFEVVVKDAITSDSEERAHRELQEMKGKSELDFFCYVPCPSHYQFFVYLEEKQSVEKVIDVFRTNNCFFRFRELM